MVVHDGTACSHAECGRSCSLLRGDGLASADAPGRRVRWARACASLRRPAVPRHARGWLFAPPTRLSLQPRLSQQPGSAQSAQTNAQAGLPGLASAPPCRDGGGQGAIRSSNTVDTMRHAPCMLRPLALSNGEQHSWQTARQRPTEAHGRRRRGGRGARPAAPLRPACDPQQTHTMRHACADGKQHVR
jgi:hypothetical protein